jgi:Ser/Thr protein kinase RdoA (MazF antagonist)
LASVGLQGDGRLMALSSYENRVYQVHLEDPHDGHSAVVAKFYRPGRWSEAQILEEHAFAAELMAAEVPAVGPLVLHGRTLHQHSGFAFSVSPGAAGAARAGRRQVLEWIGRFLARIHTVGAARPFAPPRRAGPADLCHRAARLAAGARHDPAGRAGRLAGRPAMKLLI